MSVRRHLVLDTSLIIGVAVAWLLTVMSYQWLAPRPLPKVDLGTTDDTVVLVHLEQLRTKENRLDIKVLVKPDDSILDKRLNRLTADTAVRFPTQHDLGELRFPTGRSPELVAATIDAHGEATDWPFDTYSTDPIEADVLVGAGDTSHYEPARVEVEGVVDGFDIFVTRVGDDANRPDNVIITLKRTRGPLVFDIGICLVLITLPAVALFVAIQMVTRRRPFLPPFGTWYAAMLFAVVPLRNFLPGSPPTGAFIDQAIVIWVLIGLATAMVIYIVAWYRDQG